MEWSYFIQRTCNDNTPVTQQPKPEVVWLQDERLEVQGAQLIKLSFMERRVYSRDFLFVGRVSELPEDPQKAPHDCICIADAPLPKSYTRESYPGNLLVIDAAADVENLMLLLNHINFVLADDFRYYRGLDRINNAAGCDMAWAVQLAERLCTNPAFLMDDKGRVLGCGGTYRFTDERLNAAVAEGVVPKPLYAEIRNSSVYLALCANYEQLQQELAWSKGKTLLCVPIRIRGLDVAHLVIHNSWQAFHWSTIQLMKPLAELIADIIDRRMDEANERTLLHNLLFAELLRVVPEREPELRSRIEELAWRELPGMRLVCCEGPEASFEALRQAYPTAHWTFAEEQWLLLVYPAEGEPPLMETLAASGLRAGVSWPVDSLMRLPYAWVEAKTALQQGSTPVGDYAEVFAAHVCTLPPALQREHLHPAVRRLIQYDRNHEGTLLDTLATYLAGPEQPKEAAARLFISRSTLFYRLGRIRELCSVDLTTGEERMNLLLSLRLWNAIKD